MTTNGKAEELLNELLEKRGARTGYAGMYARKLTADQVRLAREVYRLAYPHQVHGLISDLAKKMGVSTSNMACVVHGKSYRWVK